MALLITIVVTTFEILGLLSAVVALFHARTSQGAIAWILSLITIPVIAVPLFWVFGRHKFRGYVIQRQTDDSKLSHIVESIRAKENWSDETSYDKGRLRALKALAKLPYTQGNRTKLLIDGQATFDNIFAGIAGAEEYILIQFFIVRDDEIGRQLQERLIDKARQGVKIFFLYDQIGSNKLPGAYLDELRAAGVHISPFRSTRGILNRLQINFRNHRKIVVVDGQIGWLGGLNVGDEYLGRSAFGPWRDTHIRIEGPAVLGLMFSFVEDWHWATGEQLELDWEKPVAHKDGHTVIIIPSGPADPYDTASLMIQQAIQAAKKRFWIASPYFVPDVGVIQALHLAALRGVDVRILIPDKPDHFLPYLSAFAFVGDMIKSGVNIYRYTAGFLHQKVFLVDANVSAVSTVNLDNRSFRLNFEITAIVFGPRFARQVEKMFKRDLENSRQMTIDDVRGKNILFKLACRASYLAAPVQ
ncbi:cardiolipin synthase [candidate division KSB1 bacterium]|nr:cardiolipin synthase [candidate division KSB1 bacterium]